MTVTAEQAVEDIQALLGRAELGETIVIERSGHPIVQLRPANPALTPDKRRILGALEGQGVIPDDIKGPYEAEINEMFYGK